MKNDEKTIPYIFSPAELANFRILRKKIHSFGTNADDEEEENLSGEIKVWNSDPGPINKIVANEKHG